MLREDHTIMLCMLAWDRLEKGTLPGGRDCLPRTVLLGVHNAVTLLSQLGREVLTPKNNKWLNFSLKCEYRLLINTIQKVGWLSPARSAAIATALLVGVRRGQGWRTLVTWDLEIKIINSLCGALHQCCWPWSRSGLQQPWKKIALYGIRVDFSFLASSWTLCFTLLPWNALVSHLLHVDLLSVSSSFSSLLLDSMI